MTPTRRLAVLPSGREVAVRRVAVCGRSETEVLSFSEVAWLPDFYEWDGRRIRTRTSRSFVRVESVHNTGSEYVIRAIYQ